MSAMLPEHGCGGSFTVPADHPCLAGHFPSGAIVPAVLLLDLACAVLRQSQPQVGTLLQVKSAKFLLPVLPGETVQVRFDNSGQPGSLRLTCGTAVGVAVQAQLQFAGA